MDRPCAGCGDPIVGRHGSARYCSDTCSDRMEKRRHRAKHGNPKWAGPTYTPATCAHCGDPFISSDRKHIYCTPACRADAVRWKKRDGLHSVIPWSRCPDCSAWRTRPGRCAQCVAAILEAKARRHAHLHSPRPCAECGERFTPKPSQAGQQRYCSNSCRIRIRSRRRRARERGAPGSFSRADFLRMVRRCGSRCYWCHEVRDLVADHVIPLARGGSNGIGNIVPSCTPCNSHKRDLLPVEWLHGRRPTVTSTA